MLAIQTDAGIDTLLLHEGTDPHQRLLLDWAARTPELHSFVCDYRRLQLEAWLWQAWKREQLVGRIMDIGVYDRREWMGAGYFTFGERAADVLGDLTTVTPETLDGPVDTIVCTEVLEHVGDMFAACRQMFACLRPGGRLFASAPFLWPDHGIEGEYGDNWRILAGGWRLLLRQFADVTIIEPAWTAEGAQFYNFLRRAEGWGFTGLVHGSTGYFVSAVKPEV